MSLQNIKNQKGFTIVELLIVIVVIGILAAITIVAYNGIQNRAKDTSASEMANQLRTKVGAWQGVKGSYPAFTDVTGGLVDTDVKESAMSDDLKGKIFATEGITPDADKPVAYKKCTTDGAIITYYQTSGTAKNFKVGDTTTCS